MPTGALAVPCPRCESAAGEPCLSLAKRWRGSSRAVGVGDNGWRKRPHQERVHAATGAPTVLGAPYQGGPTTATRVACQATIDDLDRPKLHAPRQRISVPGDKPCTRRATARFGALCLCATHVRLAQEGLLTADGRVRDKNTIRDVRSIRDGGRRGRAHARPNFQIETWHLNLKPEAL